MKTSMTNQAEPGTAIVGIYGGPKTGKTFALRTALPLGPVLHISSPGEGDAESSLRDFPVQHFLAECYEDLMALELVLCGKPADWVGDPSDPPVARLKKAIDPAKIQQVRDLLGDTKPFTIALDGLFTFQSDIFGAHSIVHYGKDTGIGRYGDIADSSTIHTQRLASAARLLVLITQDQQVSDKSLGGVESTYREMAFEGQKSRKIIPPMCSMILPIFSCAQLGDSFKPWRCPVDKPGEMADRYFALVSYMGYYAGARVGMTSDTSVRADLSHIYNKYYTKSKEAVSK